MHGSSEKPQRPLIQEPTNDQTNDLAVDLMKEKRKNGFPDSIRRVCLSSKIPTLKFFKNYLVILRNQCGHSPMLELNRKISSGSDVGAAHSKQNQINQNGFVWPFDTNDQPKIFFSVVLCANDTQH